MLLGEAPSRGSDPTRPFSGRSGDRLRALVGGELEERFEVANVLGEWPGSAGKGSRWPRPLIARARMVEVTIELGLAGRMVVACGRRVAAAGGVPACASVLEWIDGPLFRVAVLPHPSGVNRWWNEPGNVESARAFLAAASRGREL
jgi:uracil-DNA glycosylase